MVATARARRTKHKELTAILALFFGVFLSLCLASYDPADPALNVATNSGTVSNLCGEVGAYLADFLFMFFGVSAYIVAGVFFLVSGMLFLGRQVHVTIRQTIAYLIMIFSAASILHLRFEEILLRGQAIEAGGVIGGMLGSLAAQHLNITGAYIAASALFCIAFFYATPLSPSILLQWTWEIISYSAQWAWQWTTIYFGRLSRALPKWWKRTAKALRSWRKQRALAKRTAQSKRAANSTPATPRAPVKITRQEQLPLEEEEYEEAQLLADNEDEIEDDDELEEDEEYVEGEEDDEDLEDDEEYEEEDDEDEYEDDEEYEEEEDDEEELEDGEEEEEEEEEDIEAEAGPTIYERKDAAKPLRRSSQLELTRISQNYVFPPLNYLDASEGQLEVDEEHLRHNAGILESKLAEYGIGGHVSEIHPGPVITMYEFVPAAGVKVNKIVNAADDLSISLGGRAVRVVPHLPGKAAVGVEIPNADRETVYLRDVIGTQKFKKVNSPIPLAMGKNIEGHPVVADLAKMPHLLVAGATGAGKSVAINSMICSILYKSSPADVRMILVDPKMLELSIYNGIPHLLLPVVTKPQQANMALKWAVREMERRYRHLSDAKVRNIASYNEKISSGAIECVSEEHADELLAENPEAIAHTGKLPYIVIVIDEMADLMMVAARDIEESVIRLAQMARACGIHLVLATQRPSVDVITGLIKANFPSRCSFKVSSKHDSRTIIDTVGAEHLLGAGDMLFMAPSVDGLVRLHGAFLQEEEIEQIVTHVKSQAQPHYDETILQPPPGETVDGAAESEQDELYDRAVQVVTENGSASISMVQRRMRIGYNRAARLVERMETEGIVGPAVGSKPREILVQSH